MLPPRDSAVILHGGAGTITGRARAGSSMRGSTRFQRERAAGVNATVPEDQQAALDGAWGLTLRPYVAVSLPCIVIDSLETLQA